MMLRHSLEKPLVPLSGFGTDVYIFEPRWIMNSKQELALCKESARTNSWKNLAPLRLGPLRGLSLFSLRVPTFSQLFHCSTSSDS